MTTTLNMKWMTVVFLFFPVVVWAQNYWRVTYEPGEDIRGLPLSVVEGSTTNHQDTECDGTVTSPSVIYSKFLEGPGAAVGTGYAEAGILTDVDPACSEHWTVRGYRTYKVRSDKFKLPFVVVFRLYIEAPDTDFIGDRFSQSTFKGNDPKGDTGQLLTTHIYKDRTVDIGHSKKGSMQINKAVKVPLNEWHSHGIYVENVNGKTMVTTWVNDRVAATAEAKGVWTELRSLHFGFYGDDNAEGKIRNDEIEAREVSNISEARDFIEENAGPYGLPDTVAPAAPTNLGTQ